MLCSLHWSVTQLVAQAHKTATVASLPPTATRNYPQLRFAAAVRVTHAKCASCCCCCCCCTCLAKRSIAEVATAAAAAAAACGTLPTGPQRERPFSQAVSLSVCLCVCRTANACLLTAAVCNIGLGHGQNRINHFFVLLAKNEWSTPWRSSSCRKGQTGTKQLQCRLNLKLICWE